MTWDVRQGDARVVLATLPEASVQCVVTSPPYWGLRDYGTARWEGGDPACFHNARTGDLRFAHPLSAKQASNAGSAGSAGSECRACGATRKDEQLGLERTPDEYVARLVTVFREVRRVLRDDGTLWLNLGDSYANDTNDTKWGGSSGGKHVTALHGDSGIGRAKRVTGLKAKDLVGIPWRAAFALQDSGWWLRSDIIWSKPNPMPESVTDRPTKAHEYLFLLSKRATYFYDADAIREPHTSGENTEAGLAARAAIGDPNGKRGDTKSMNDGRDRTKPPSRPPGYIGHVNGRNRRSVWRITSQPFPEAHFAVMPEALVEPCILAGSKPGDLVLDPFAGSCTVGVVALRYGRRFFGIDLNPAYVEMGRRRMVGPLFAAAPADSNPAHVVEVGVGLHALAPSRSASGRAGSARPTSAGPPCWGEASPATTVVKCDDSQALKRRR